MRINFNKLFASFGAVFVVGEIGSAATFQAIPTWYATLNKPFFSPPNWIFGPVWTMLYILMAVALYLVWSDKTKNIKSQTSALHIFFVQLFFNALWSIAFFGFHSPLFGLVVIVVMLVAIVDTIKKFSLINKLASQLLYPYLVWVSFASILNLAVFLLNL